MTVILDMKEADGLIPNVMKRWMTVIFDMKEAEGLIPNVMKRTDGMNARQTGNKFRQGTSTMTTKHVRTIVK